MDETHWYDEKTAADAAVWYSAEAADAWAAGYNAAVQAFKDEWEAALKEQQ